MFYNEENGSELAVIILYLLQYTSTYLIKNLIKLVSFLQNFFSLRDNSSKEWDHKNTIEYLQKVAENNGLDFENEIILHLG